MKRRINAAKKKKKSKSEDLASQVSKTKGKTVKKKKELDGNTEVMISTGSTLLDLAISGERIRGGGIPGGIFVEIFGPSGSGKTVMLCEIAGDLQRKGGQVMFKDPEARLNKQFASLFDLKVDEMDLDQPNTVPEVFEPVRDWVPDDEDKVNGIFADSLAALSTDMEMDGKDQYGMRRAKEFSEELRKTCRVLASRNMLMVASNQIRTNVDAGMFEEKQSAPGGKAIEFYASLRIRVSKPTKIKLKKKIHGTEVTKVIGVTSKMECYKNSCDAPYRTAPVTILFDYGIDDIRENLIFIKKHSANKVYTLGGENLSNSIDKSIAMVEDLGEEGINQLKEEVIDLWEEIQEKFASKRTRKIRS